MNGFLQKFTSFCKQVFRGIKELKNFRLSYLRKVFSLMGKREKMAVAALLVVALANLGLSLRNFYYAHTVTVPGNGGTYVEGMLGQPAYINPLLAHQDTDQALTALIYNGLYKYDSSGNLVPDLADGMPQISEDQKQYTVNLKHNVKWHNNKTFTADDVVFTVKTLQDQDFKSPLRLLWLSTSVEKLSDYSVRFTTKDISGPFIHNLTLPIMPQSVWGRMDAQGFLLSHSNLEPIGTGPYVIKEKEVLPSGKVQAITLEAFTDYFAGRPKIDNVKIRFYDTEADLLNALHGKEISAFGYAPLGSNLYLEKDQNNLQFLSLPLPQYQVVFFNLNNKTLAEQGVRQALEAATDRQKIISEVFKGNAVLPTSPFDPTKPPLPASADLEKAKKLLDDTGWKIDPKTNLRSKKNASLELTIATNDSLLNSEAAEALANQWKALDIKVNLTILPTKQLTDGHIRTRNFEVLLFPLKFGADHDPFSFWHSSQVKDPGYNLTGFSDQNIDKLITEARTTTDQAVRQEKYKEFDRLISEKSTVIFLDQTLYIFALDKNIKNISLQKIYDPSQRFFDLPNWYMQEKRVWKQ